MSSWLIQKSARQTSAHALHAHLDFGSSKRQQPHRPHVPVIIQHRPADLPGRPLLTFLPLVHTEEVTGSIPVSPTQLSGQLRSCSWPFVILQLASDAARHAARHAPDQHVVSRVILKQFAEPYGKKQEILLAALDREHSGRKMTTASPNRYCKVQDYVRFASGAAEELWHRTETRLHEPLEAIKRYGQLSDPAQSTPIRDAIALHLVRSIPTRAYHQESWLKHREAARQRLRARPRLLQEIDVQRFGWWTSDPERLERAIDWFYGPLDAFVGSDALFRYSLEERLERLRRGFQAFDLKILSTHRREFLIGDAPVLMLREGRGGLGTFDAVGVANADEIVLPLTPHHVAVLGQGSGAAQATDEEVERYNTLEVMIAYKDVCFRPTSRLDQFIRAVLASPEPG